MARLEDTYGSGNYLKAKSLLAAGTPSLTLTVKGIDTHEFKDGTNQRVLTFQEDDRQLGLNKTNWERIAAYTDLDDDDNWIGVSVDIDCEKCEFGADIVDCIRVKGARKPGAAPAPAPSPMDKLGEAAAQRLSAWCSGTPQGWKVADIRHELQAMGVTGIDGSPDQWPRACAIKVKTAMDKLQAKQKPAEDFSLTADEIPF